MKNFYVSVLILLALGFSPVFGQTPQAPKTAQQDESTKEPSPKPERQLKAQIDVEFKKDILRLLDLNGEVRGRYQLLKNAMETMKKQVPGVKDEFWAECEGLLSKEKLSDQLATAYSSRFSHEEIKSIATFFESPAGNKFLQKMPGLISESNGITNKMGRALGVEIKERLSAAGYAQ